MKNFVTDNRKKAINEVLKNRTRHFTIALEDLYQMHNLSAMIRSDDIFAIQTLYIIQKKYDPKFSHTIAKGAEKWLDIY